MTARLLPTWTRAPFSRVDHVIAAGVAAAAATTIFVTPVGSFIAKVAGFGIAGFALEAAYDGPKYSPVFSGAKIPILPVYAAGGALILLAAPHLAMIPLLARGLVYAGLLTGLELVGCKLNRAAGHCSWDYAEMDCATDGGCIDAPHALAWGVLGLLVERIA